jgi:NAD(P)H dehydrogenase (quinone)
MFNNEEVHGGSAYGAGTLAGADGSRQPSQLELDIAESHGKHFASIASKLAYEVVDA